MTRRPPNTPPNFPPIIDQKLRSLRRTLRNYVVLDGLATSLLVLLAFLGFDLALDRFFEFSQPIRALLLAFLLASLGLMIWRRVFRRIAASISDAQWALLVEHFVPELDESLVTAVELRNNKNDELNPLLLEQTVQHAAQSIEKIDCRAFFHYRRLAARITATLLALSTCIGFSAVFSETATIWFSRNILLSRQDWPRRSLLVVDGFQNGTIRVGRGDSFTLSVRASTAMPLIPDTIRLRLGREDDSRTVVLDQFRVDSQAGEEWRVFSHTFLELLETLPFSVRGSDSTLEGLEIEVVPPPMLTEVKLKQKFPVYMERPERSTSATSRTTIPDGTSITIEAAANKTLMEAAVVVDGDTPQNILGKDIFETKSEMPHEYPIHVELNELRKDRRIEFLLRDTDSLRNRQPIRYDFTVLADKPPTVTARLDGIGSAITPNAVLPAVGEMTDDYGMAHANFRYVINRPDPPTIPETEDTTETVSDKESTVLIAVLSGTQTVLSVNAPFSVTNCKVQPGDTLRLWIESTDRFDLDGGRGQTGQGPHWTLEIVAPERLRSLLEVREIALRQRFEVLIGEVELTKELLESLSLDVPPETVKAAETLAVEAKPEDVSEEEFTKRKFEVEKKRNEILQTISKTQADAARVHVTRTLRDTQKEVYEMKTLVEAFQMIRQEMVNNRIWNGDDENRLDGGIAIPLQKLAAADFPEAAQRVSQLDETLAIHDKPLRHVAAQQRQVAMDCFDELLQQMRNIRDNMVSMESFNEVIDMLRAILRQQQQIRQETLEEKSQRLHDLLEP